jgi:hypothetical protein
MARSVDFYGIAVHIAVVHVEASMADTAESKASPDAKGVGDRSPSFPFIPLKTATERLAAFEKYFGRHPAPASKAGLAWEMKEKSSQADQTLAALRSFGLIEYQGMGSGRQALLTDEGRNYLRAQQDSVKSQILKQCALRPKIMRKFWTTWGADRPPDAVALDDLALKNGFSQAGATKFLKVYDDTISFAGLSASDKLLGDQEPLEDDDMEAGFEPGRKPPKPGTERAEFPLPEGVVRLEFPASLSTASYEDFEAWVELVLRRAKRAVSDDEATD